MKEGGIGVIILVIWVVFVVTFGLVYAIIRFIKDRKNDLRKKAKKGR